jgi:hypothetical protein
MRANTTGGAKSMCATVRRELRLPAGQTVNLSAYINTTMYTVDSGANYSKLIMVFRSV